MLENLLIILIFTLLSLLYTYPLILNFKSSILGIFYDDPQYLLWNMWWTKKAAASGKTPFNTDYIMHPLGADLALHGTPWVKNFLSIPLQKIFGLIPAHNILMLSTFVLSGYGTYTLTDYLIHDMFIAIIAGLIYAFCSYRMSSVFLSNYLSTEWIPFYIYFLILSMTETHYTPALTAGFFLALSFYDHPYYTVFLLMFTAIYSSYLLLMNSLWLTGIIVIIFVFVILCAPLLTAMKNQINSNAVTPLEDIPSLSLDLLSPVIPYFTYPMNIFKKLYYKISPEFIYSGFIGFIPLFLICFSAIDIKNNSFIALWFVTAIIFFSFSLGPYLKIAGNYKFSIGSFSFSIPMPYYIFHYLKIPGINYIRFTYRFASIMMLCAAVLSAYGLKYLSASFLNSSSCPIFFSLVFIGIILEDFKIPFPFQSREYVHPFYYQLALKEDNFSVLDIPFVIYSSEKRIGKRFSNGQYYQTIHNKPILNGVVSYMPLEHIGYFERLPFLSTLIDLENEGMIPEISDNERLRIAYLFDLFDIRYIIIHNTYPIYYTEDGLTCESVDSINRYILSALNVTEVWGEEKSRYTSVYEKQKAAAGVKSELGIFFKEVYKILSGNQVYKIYRVDIEHKKYDILFDFDGMFSDIHLITGWSKLETDAAGTSFRWGDKNRSELIFKINSKNPDRILTFMAKSSDIVSQILRVYINDEQLTDVSIKSFDWEQCDIVIPSKFLKNGINLITFNYKGLNAAFSKIGIK